MDFLDKLNPQQRKAVTAADGPVLVVAGPGSGKTRVLTQRIAYLIASEGVRPWQILAVTFTNKAAKEMDQRVKSMLNVQAADGLALSAVEGLMLGTFHSICARILRREVEHLPLESNFVIFDSDDQERIVKVIIKELNLNDKLYRAVSIHAAISRAKNELIGPDDYPINTYRDEVIKRVYDEYQRRLIASNAVDFDDLLVYTARLLEDNPAVRDKYAQRFRHVLVDEFQDTNLAQYALVKQLASYHKNIFCVGDPDQCFPSGTKIQTPRGQKKIEDLKKGDEVIAASGRGSTMKSNVSRVGKRTFNGNLVKVKTRGGNIIKVTPNHIVFARLGMKPGWHYVYLMYRKDKGYRIGIASHARSDGDTLKVGLQVRSNQENATQMWVLKVCTDRNEAHYWESYYSIAYGIPTTVFHVRGRRMRMSQEYIDRLFLEIDTDTNANQLLTEIGMDIKYPHYTPQGTFRNIVNLRYFGDGRITEESPWHAHRVDLWSSDKKLAKQIALLGYNPRIRSRDNWRVGINRLQYDAIQEAAQKLSEAANDADIVVGAFLVDKGNSPLAQKFNLMPASHLHPSMIVAIEKDGQIVEDEIVEVSSEPYQGTVYDFEVENLHNYIADGMVVHNSVYAWRGADYRNIKRFEEDFPEAEVVLLEQNYRSHQNILDAAMSVIDRAKTPNRRKKKLFSDRGAGEKILFYEARDDYSEAAFVVDTIAELVASRKFEPGDCAVMYRTNAMSRLIEEAFLQARLPYRLVGAQRFYGRREVKDVIAFIRLAHNPADEAALGRIINVPPRSIGEKTLTTLHMVARQNETSPGAVLLDLARGADSPYYKAFTGRAALPLADFGGLLSNWHAAAKTSTTIELFDRIIRDVNFKAHILEDETEESAERWENVEELKRIAYEFSTRTLDEFLENIALVADQDTITDANAPTLLTLHAAKGLEFGAVFIIGLDDGIIPHSRSFDEPEQMEEERRLFYVGITRAKDKLYLLRAIQRGGRGMSEQTYPSRFLEDLPENLLVGKTRTGRPATSFSPSQSFYRTPSPSESRWTLPTPPKAAPVATNRFNSGDRVKHQSFGEGIVQESRIQDGDEIVVIEFKSVGLKRLAASLAKLEIIQ